MSNLYTIQNAKIINNSFKKLSILIPVTEAYGDNGGNFNYITYQLYILICHQKHIQLPAILNMAYNNARLIAKPESNWLATI